MSRRSSIKTAIQAPSLPALDPCNLGRPMHLLGHFGDGLRERVARCFATRINPRYGTTLEVGAIAFDTAIEPPAADVLPGGNANTAGLTVSLDRRVILRVLECRYGLQRNAPPGSGSAEALPPSSSEQRIAAQLGGELLDLLAGHIGPAGEPESVPRRTPARGSRAVLRGVCRVGDASHGELGQLGFTLDALWQSRVFAKLSPAGRHARPGELTADVLNQLAITLYGQLLELRVPLDELLALHAGSLIPIRLGARARVMIGTTPALTAQVVEHDGKLSLTDFADTE